MMKDRNIQNEEQIDLIEEMIQFIIPKYNEAHDIMVSLLDLQSNSETRIADLGCGFGDLTSNVMHVFPQSIVFGVERHQDILWRAHQKLREISDQFLPMQRDLNDDTWMNDIDHLHAVMSSFTLDYLPVSRHKQVIQESYDMMEKGSRWISCEFFRSKDNRVNRVFHDLEMNFIQKALADGKVSKEQIDQLSQSTILRQEHHVVTVEEKKQWLQDAGFHTIEVPWRFLNLAIISGVK